MDVLLQRIELLINVTDPRAGVDSTMTEKTSPYFKSKFSRPEKSQYWVIVGPFVLEEIRNNVVVDVKGIWHLVGFLRYICGYYIERKSG
jgi:hypothetical protein